MAREFLFAGIRGDRRGERVWYHVVSLPNPFDPSLFRWRSGQRYTIPELIDPTEEEKIRNAPPPPEPDDPLDKYIVVTPRA